MPRPAWMTKDEYAQMPQSVEIRLVDVTVRQPGSRTKQFTVATTLTDDSEVSGDCIRSVDESRWLVELDIRAIKSLVEHGHPAGADSGDGSDGTLVVSAGVQSDATEDASEWCGRRS